MPTLAHFQLECVPECLLVNIERCYFSSEQKRLQFVATCNCEELRESGEASGARAAGIGHPTSRRRIRSRNRRRTAPPSAGQPASVTADSRTGQQKLSAGPGPVPCGPAPCQECATEWAGSSGSSMPALWARTRAPAAMPSK